jgi:hypothetical protein
MGSKELRKADKGVQLRYIDITVVSLQTILKETGFLIWSSSSQGAGVKSSLRSRGLTVCRSVLYCVLHWQFALGWLDIGCCGKYRFMAPKTYYVRFPEFGSGLWIFQKHPMWFFFKLKFWEEEGFSWCLIPCLRSQVNNHLSLSIFSEEALFSFGGCPLPLWIALLSKLFPVGMMSLMGEKS